MKLRTFLGCILASAICVNAYSMNIQNGKLISQAESVSTHAKATFDEYVPTAKRQKALDYLSKQNNSSAKMYVGASAIVTNSFVAEGNMYIYSHADFYFANFTSEPKTYRIITRIGTFTSSNFDVIQHIDTISLDANGRAEMHRSPFYTTAINANVEYDLALVWTEVIDDASNVIYSSGDAQEIVIEKKQ